MAGHIPLTGHLRITCITMKNGRPHIDMSGSSNRPDWRNGLRSKRMLLIAALAVP